MPPSPPDTPAARQPRFVVTGTVDAPAERDAATAGLLARPATLAPRWFYDRLGSMLFDAITELDAYYPTRTEAAIFAAHGRAMAERIGTGHVLVDLGAGNGAKAARLFPLLEPRRYVAVDVSVAFLRDALVRIQRENPRLEVVGVGADFAHALELPTELLADAPPLFFYPGSSLGNFTPAEAVAFLRRVHALARDGGLLIGLDLVKDLAVLERAYDDELGVTAAFNLNALLHLNRVVGTDFDPRDWRHVARFDADRSRIEMHLEARRAVVVAWPGGERRFAAGERLHTESSYKYTRDGAEALLREAGFGAAAAWTDERGWFVTLHARA